MEKNVKDSIFISRLDKRIEVWRYLFYVVLHAGWIHLLFNLIVQVLVGLPLEMVHGSGRIAVVYVAGVLAGSLGTSVFDPDVYSPRDTKMIITYTRNVGFATTMTTVEKCTYESNWSEKDGEVTHLRRQAWIDSQVRGFGPILQRFGIERYQLNAHNATKGLQYVLNQLFSAPSSGKSAGLVSSHSMTDLRTRTLESTKAPM